MLVVYDNNQFNAGTFFSDTHSPSCSNPLYFVFIFWLPSGNILFTS